MRYIYIFIWFCIFVLLLGFALKNSDPVELHYYLGFAWRAPLSLMLLTTLLIGIITGIIGCLTPLIRQRRQLLALQRELKALNPENQL